MTFSDCIVVHVALHFVSARAFFFGVLKNAATLELECFDEIEQLDVF